MLVWDFRTVNPIFMNLEVNEDRVFKVIKVLSAIMIRYLLEYGGPIMG